MLKGRVWLCLPLIFFTSIINFLSNFYVLYTIGLDSEREKNKGFRFNHHGIKERVSGFTQLRTNVENVQSLQEH